MTATLPPRLRTLAEIRSGRVLSAASAARDRSLVAVLIGDGIDLATRCVQCARLLLDHDGPLIKGVAVNEGPAPLYGDMVCADASALLPGDVHDGGWVGHGVAA